MLKILSVADAKKTILQRDHAFLFDEQTMTEQAKEFSRRLHDGRVLTPEQGVRRILQTVREEGDNALRHWTKALDGVTVETFAVDSNEITAALHRIDSDLRAALELAASRIEKFHRYQPLPNWTTTEMGGILGQRVTAIERVGVYVPGGTAPLPSSLLMGVIPAKVAGVRSIVVSTPPGKDGRVPDVILAAAAIAGIDEVITLGGAQAIGAMAFGTEQIKKVDKIVGPGSLFVTLAKQQVYGIVGIDGLYGPTETVVVADESADPEWIAADLLAQAEHDILATAILFTPSIELAHQIVDQVTTQMKGLNRQAILEQSLANQSGIVLTADLDEACQLATDFAAEHTCIACENPEQYIDKIPNAGGLFVGERSFEVLGDYVAGPSHTMPTGATARFASPLNVSDFVKISSIIRLDDETSRQLSPVAAMIARAEQLDGHANAAQKRVA